MQGVGKKVPPSPLKPKPQTNQKSPTKPPQTNKKITHKKTPTNLQTKQPTTRKWKICSC